MHIRHGDKGIESMLLPFGRYLGALEVAAAQPGCVKPRCIFIATDDPDINNVPRTDVAGYKVIGTWTSRPEILNGLAKTSSSSKTRSRGYKKSHAFLLDMLLLARARTLVFTYSSNFGAAAMLLSSRHLCPPPKTTGGTLPTLIPLDTYFQYPEAKRMPFLALGSRMPTIRSGGHWDIGIVEKRTVVQAVFCNEECPWHQVLSQKCTSDGRTQKLWWWPMVLKHTAMLKEFGCWADFRRASHHEKKCWPTNEREVAYCGAAAQYHTDWQ
jgi:hypothetical protein